MEINEKNIFLFYYVEWVGEEDTETGGRLGLWQICQKDEMTDSCSGKLEDLFQLPTFSFKVWIKNVLSTCHGGRKLVPQFKNYI